MTGLFVNKWERKTAKRKLAFTVCYSRGYEQGALEMKQYLTEQVIYSINQDAVLRMTADVDTLERVVEIIEAVRDIGKA
jgi:hypothetical protein